MYINFKNTCYKVTVLGNIIQSVLNYSLMRPVSNLRLPKEQKKQAKTANSKKTVREVSKSLKIELFRKKNIFIFN